jgi:hypothetical protein
MPKKYVVGLTEAEREHLERLVRKGKAHARKLLYARILLSRPMPTKTAGPTRE